MTDLEKAAPEIARVTSSASRWVRILPNKAPVMKIAVRLYISALTVAIVLILYKMDIQEALP